MGSVKSSKFQVLVKPMITEKAAAVKDGVVFEVHPLANKSEIKQAVEQIFETKVRAVKTANFPGKLRRVKNIVGRQKNWKKAYVYLEEGHSLDFIEGL